MFNIYRAGCLKYYMPSISSILHMFVLMSGCMDANQPRTSLCGSGLIYGCKQRPIYCWNKKFLFLLLINFWPSNFICCQDIFLHSLKYYSQSGIHAEDRWQSEHWPEFRQIQVAAAFLYFSSLNKSPHLLSNKLPKSKNSSLVSSRTQQAGFPLLLCNSLHLLNMKKSILNP